ncbi:endonuclease/exonuclease/phosphatase family protein [Antiquaquibacter oligotrophicus]|uniref:endonuclease/exonuclease/phosphatase family protein n=1 Tax=Antiquaquibacter oligotrophicus TaxID=2880260 RepID=UPI002AC8EE4A|nr:endonuclease/exonuclease/phosphatase family protein [Antiquaquibacter oligotrophicus]UDF14737.1 endonuclease/exonuclease/phosphatase family protein [Antiquaquibacter oligotrophicus]
MRVISYNLRKHRAIGELAALSETADLDALCLQEAFSSELPGEIGPLTLAGSTKNNRLGLAVYYRKDRYDHVESRSYELKKSLHDLVFSPTPERLVGSRLVDRETGQQLVVASFHAAPLTALNSLRREQIKAAHELLQELGSGTPILMVGDYNYPLFKDGLGERVAKTGYDLSLSDRRTYTAYKFFRGHFDFVTSQGFTIESVETLARGSSDHIPILVTAAYGEPDYSKAGKES